MKKKQALSKAPPTPPTRLCNIQCSKEEKFRMEVRKETRLKSLVSRETASSSSSSDVAQEEEDQSAL